MPRVPGIENLPPIQPFSGGGHSDHGTNATAPNASTGQSFSAALAQAMNQGTGVHDGHGRGSVQVGAPPHSGGHNATASAPNGETHSRHFPINGSNHGEEHGLQETILGLRAYRQGLIASNIANADTPGYKAVDIDFQEALRIARSVANAPPVTLSTTAPGHILGQAQSAAPPYPLKYHVPSQPSVDGNTVELDVERAKFAENAVMWEFSRDRVSGHLKMMMKLFQSLKY